MLWRMKENKGREEKTKTDFVYEREDDLMNKRKQEEKQSQIIKSNQTKILI